MTSCKEIIHTVDFPKPKRTVFRVEIDIDNFINGDENRRHTIVKDLKKAGFVFTDELADIIREG
ncbi:hypothetical protein LCGC14_0774090 [marine sediment metagenome]|uniref:Uncharacterized protein n=1 Tax=marine sediment metagenome TaxID=412755 RepID=A0A0F9SHD6_9ZZZZ